MPASYVSFMEDICKSIERISWKVPDALFFLGVLFAVGGLERVGLLKAHRGGCWKKKSAVNNRVQVVQSHLFIHNRWVGHDFNLWVKGSRKFTIPKKGHKLAELLGWGVERRVQLLEEVHWSPWQGWTLATIEIFEVSVWLVMVYYFFMGFLVDIDINKNDGTGKSTYFASFQKSVKPSEKMQKCQASSWINMKKVLPSYCWWLKSCTSWYGKYPIIYRVSYIPGGAGFQPSTVVNS